MCSLQIDASMPIINSIQQAFIPHRKQKKKRRILASRMILMIKKNVVHESLCFNGPEVCHARMLSVYGKKSWNFFFYTTATLPPIFFQDRIPPLPHPSDQQPLIIHIPPRAQAPSHLPHFQAPCSTKPSSAQPPILNEHPSVILMFWCWFNLNKRLHMLYVS
jgi:hypothetical protein